MHIVDIDRAFFAVFGEAVARSAASKVGPFGGMDAGQRAVRDGVTINVEIAAERLARVQIFGSHDFAAVILACIVPGKRLAQPIVHANVEIFHDEDGCLKPLREIEGLGSHVEQFARVLRKQQNMFGVAVTGIGAQ